VSRWVSVGLALLLLGICGALVFGARDLHSSVLASQNAGRIADLYQDARYYAAAEDAGLAKYRTDPSITNLESQFVASEGLDRALAALADQPGTTARSAQALGLLLEMHARYQRLVVREVLLLDEGRRTAATRLERARIDPTLRRLGTQVERLENSHHQQAVAGLGEAALEGARLQIGVPAIMGLALLLLAAFALATRRYRRSLERQALSDALTHLPNRRLFADRLTHAMAASGRAETEPVVLLMDLDRFKEVNDTLGHHHGDELLVELAHRVSDLLRPGDTLARLGGDEFAVLLPDGGREVGAEVAARILAGFEEPFTLAGISVGVEASIGIATADHDEMAVLDLTGEEPPDLLQQADTAMYAAKRERCGFRHYTAGLELATPAHLTLLGELRQAFDRDEMVVHYQPKIAVHTGELLGVEALVRWQHPGRGLLPPVEFIALAEGTTLIHRLTAIVLGKALRHTRGWLDRGVRLPVAVNVSARTLLDHTFPGLVGEQLAAAGVTADLLCLEITESTIMADPDRALAILTELHQMGVRLSVDDFGTGYSSMAYLKVLPVDELKVDRSFVCDMTRDPDDTVLVQSAIDLGHNLGLSVVAEGVEDQATLAALAHAGADVVQGYHLGRPMTTERLREWIVDRVPQAPVDQVEGVLLGQHRARRPGDPA
jgi:diguanylate cyclase